MSKRIIYPYTNTGGVCVITPLNPDIPIEEIAKKDTPAGLPYIIIDSSLIPKDELYMYAWEADFSNPDGYGIGPEAWFAQQKDIKND